LEAVRRMPFKVQSRVCRNADVASETVASVWPYPYPCLLCLCQLPRCASTSAPRLAAMLRLLVPRPRAGGQGQECWKCGLNVCGVAKA
jgi:hypothetical protein